MCGFTLGSAPNGNPAEAPNSKTPPTPNLSSKITETLRHLDASNYVCHIHIKVFQCTL